MPDRPIIFSAPMIVALLEGRKTQTRRLLKLPRRYGPITEFGPSDTRGYDWHFRDGGKRWHDLRDCELRLRLPYAAGDRLWVRERHRFRGSTYLQDGLDPEPEWYRIRGSGGPGDCWDPDFPDDWWPRDYVDLTEPGEQEGPDIISHATPWRSPIHMPRWASRITLTVTDVRVQRLQSISRDDAIAEGIQRVGAGVLRWERWTGADGQCGMSPEAAYALLWNSLHGPGSWDKNPWVVAVSFRVEFRNIDAPASTSVAA